MFDELQIMFDEEANEQSNHACFFALTGSKEQYLPINFFFEGYFALLNFTLKPIFII